MKVLYYTFGVCSLLLILYGCNKGIASTYSLEKMDKSRFNIIDREIKSIENIAGVYSGNICDNVQGNVNKVKMHLLEDSTYDLICESTSGNKKMERISGFYGYNNDTLTLYTATHNKHFIIKNNSLNYICDSLLETNNQANINLLIKN